MKVMKFGGTSLAGPDPVKQVFNIINKQLSENKILVVVSAMAGVTDGLLLSAESARDGNKDYETIIEEIKNRHIETANSLLNDIVLTDTITAINDRFSMVLENLHGIYLLRELSPGSKDKILGAGEYLSAHILKFFFQVRGVKADLIDSADFITGENRNGSVKIDYDKTYARIASLKLHNLIIAPGFVASGSDGKCITLGRGGSDYSAALFAAGLDTESLEIWTDVDGIFTADPGMVPSSYLISRLSYQEALELSHFGAKIIYPLTIHPVFSKKIPVNIRNTFNPEGEGTIISSRVQRDESIIKGLSSVSDISLILVSGSGMVGVSGISSRLFSSLAKKYLNVILITQASSEHSICIAVNTEVASQAVKAIKEEFSYELSVNKINRIDREDGFSIVSIVGEKMIKTVGISGKALGALGKNGINIHAISQGSSELNISLVIKKELTRKSLNILHEEFFLSSYKTVNLYIAGTGNVGSKLLQMIEKQEEYLKKKKGVRLVVKGITNSRKMIFNDEGISLHDWKDHMESGEKADIKRFAEKIITNNFRNSIFIDNTANDQVSGTYGTLISSSVSIVTCNKIAASSEYSCYSKLKESARKKNIQFLFESNVGAGLPVINTINNLKNSGDDILKIEGVLSGSVNFILNRFLDGRSIRESVEEAMQKGFTEPDPRIDLSGTDIGRKILILAREAGYNLEPGDVSVKRFLPESCFNTPGIPEFIAELDQAEKDLTELRQKANEGNKKLRFIARFSDPLAVVNLEEVDSKNPFYNVEDTDNMIVLYTRWYNSQPLVIKGAGAGAELTSSGIMSDIMQITGNGFTN